MMTNTKVLRLSAASAILLLAASCASNSNIINDTPITITTLHDAITSNNLLYAPETWGFLQASTAGQLSQVAALTTQEARAKMPSSPEQIFQNLAQEMSEGEAAFILNATLQFNLGDMGVNIDQVKSWEQKAFDEKDVQSYYMVTQLAEQDVDASVFGYSAEDIKTNFAEVSKTDTISKLYFYQLTNDKEELQSTLYSYTQSGDLRLGSTKDIAKMIYLASLYSTANVSGLVKRFSPQILEAAKLDDSARVLLALSYKRSGMSGEAQKITSTIDTRRVQPDGTTLEPVNFSGTLGSTYRVLSYYLARGPLDEQISPDDKKRILKGVHTADKTTSLGMLAAMAINVQLGSPPPPKAEIQNSLHDFIRENNIPARNLSLEDALAWTAVSDYAQTLNTPYKFPGLSRGAASVWSEESDTDVAVPTIRLALAASRDLDPVSKHEIEVLLGRVQNVLGSSDLSQTNTFIITGGSLALQKAKMENPAPVKNIRAVIDSRRGRCLGVSENVKDQPLFLRESSEFNTVCNIDVSTYGEWLVDEKTM